MYCKFRSITCSIHINVQDPPIWLLQLARGVQLIIKELILVLRDPGVHEDSIYAAKLFVGGFEASALGGPGCEIACVHEEVGGGVREVFGWGREVDYGDVVLGVEFRYQAGGSKADARGASSDYYSLRGAFEVIEGGGIGLEEGGHIAGVWCGLG